jgi:hypothetical protein
LVLALSGCGLVQDDTPEGAVGISQGTTGDPTAVLLVCKGSFDHLEVLEMLGGGKSKPIGKYVATKPIGVGVHRVDLLHPGSGWRASMPLTVKPGLVVADARGEETGSSQTTFRFSQIPQLEPDRATGFDEGTSVALTDLAPDKCGNMAH